ncbi:MAG: hypothetical protein HRT57_03150 [Crocinitomicaceae bacterium]|nr:hypothetical protein [Crocinitomicaceae bacterium]
MRFRTILLFSILISFQGYSQNDTINQTDENGKKQGYWVYYGKDRPEAGYPDEGKIEEGPYLNDRKEGLWIKYYNDGVTPKLKGEYHNNRPSGQYWKGNLDGSERESGNFQHTKYLRTTELGGLHGDLDGLKYTDSGRLVEAVNSTKYGDSLTNLYKGESLRYLKLDSNSNYQDEAICEKWNLNNFRVYNDNVETIFEGECKNGKVRNGNFYFYDLDGILLKIEFWKDGKYYGEGKL